MKKTIAIILFFLVTIIVNATTYYVATNGNNSNPGTITQPWLTLQYAMNHLSAGDILYIRGGTYRTTYSVSDVTYLRMDGITGTSGSHITIQNYPGESPVFNLDNLGPSQTTYCFVFYISGCSYIDFKGLRITSALQSTSGYPISGMYLTNSPNCTFERVEVDHIGGYGIALASGSNNILFKNCDVHHNVDLYGNPNGNNAPYEDANGFNITGGSTATNITFDGCRSWNNADDGWDFFDSDGSFTLNNCWSFWNGYDDALSPLGDGQGFKLGPNYTDKSTSHLRTYTNCLAVHNRTNGFDQNTIDYSCIMWFYHCIAYDNGNYGFQLGYSAANGIANILRNNISYGNDGGTVYLNPSGIVQSNNSWNGGVSVSDADFAGLTVSTLAGARQSNGDLPVLDFMHLVSGSDLRGAGVAVSGVTLDGDNNTWLNPPDIGAFQFGGGSGNTVLTVEGQTLTSTYTAAHTTQTDFTFKNNSLTTTNAGGYMLDAGDEGAETDNNKLDNAIITGNLVTWNGTTNNGTHGLFVGYNINDIISHNYVDKAPYGVVTKSGDAGTSMTWATGGVFYNIFKNSSVEAILMRGIKGVPVYNNTIYNSDAGATGLVVIQENESAGNATATDVKVFNNIFYTTTTTPMIYVFQASCLSGLQSDYNLYYSETGSVWFVVGTTWYTFAQWQGLGYDIHSYVLDPDFINTTTFVPTARLDYGTNLGASYNTGLSTTATWTVNVTPTTTAQNGTWQVGARVYAGTSATTPTVTTTAITAITSTTAISGGNVSSDGGASVTSRGVCWGTSANPTIAGNKTTDGSGVGVFVSSITGLTQGTTYHVRAYATNSEGTSYGDDLSFTKSATTLLFHGAYKSTHNGHPLEHR